MKNLNPPVLVDVPLASSLLSRIEAPVPRSTKMRPDDPAYWMLDNPSIPRTPKTVHDDCYICNDDEFARMGLPLCYPCPACGEHIAADDTVCVNGHDAQEIANAITVVGDNAAPIEVGPNVFRRVPTDAQIDRLLVAINDDQKKDGAK